MGAVVYVLSHSQIEKGGRKMITLYLIFKLTGLMIRLCLWLVLLPFRLILLPFRLLFGKPASRSGDSDGFWEGLIIGSFFF